jgi:hypothetical protein
MAAVPVTGRSHEPAHRLAAHHRGDLRDPAAALGVHTMIIASADYLSEAEVLERWPMIRRIDLRRARREQAIGHYAFHSGACYTPAQVQEWLDATYLRGRACESPESPSASSSADTTSTSPTPTEAAPGTPAGMTPELTRSVAEALASEILSAPKSPSRASSRRRRSRTPAAPLRLVKC